MKSIILLIALVAGCMAVPTPKDDLSIFFDYPSSTKIVGGILADVGAAPHSVALTTGTLIRSYFCGGSLISTRTVLTAAHCIDAHFSFGSLTSSLRGTVGTNRWNTGGTTFSFARNVTHAHYLSDVIKNDIGLLITSSAVNPTPLIRPIPLSFNHVGENVPVRVSGWGLIRSNAGSASPQLMQIDLSTISGDDCIAKVAQASVDLNVRAPQVEPHIELCTFHSPNFGTCRGDSGSALVRLDTGAQVGVVSWGFPCARGAPDMFARVSGFQDFIEQNTV